MKRIVKVGNISIGNGKIIIQSMTNTKTSDIDKTIKQINNLTKVGCQIIRVAVKDMDDAIAIKEIKKHITCPLVADIHFNYQLALKSIESGADKIRINPGNMPDEHLKEIVDACKEHQIPIRIGVNSGSLSKDIMELYGVTPKALVMEAKKEAQLLEQLGFNDIIISLKATDINTFIEANKLANKEFEYPLHIGLTESGTTIKGSIRSTYAIGELLKDNIGDTIRVSLTGDPINEIIAAKEILKLYGKSSSATLISCPTCGRIEYNMDKIIKKLEPFINTIDKDIKIAIMGCVVNGIGEGKEADLGIAGGKEKGIIFSKGKIIKTVDEKDLVKEFKKEIIKYLKEKK